LVWKSSPFVQDRKTQCINHKISDYYKKRVYEID